MDNGSTYARRHRAVSLQSPLARFANTLVQSFNARSMMLDRSRPFVGLNIGYQEKIYTRGVLQFSGHVSTMILRYFTNTSYISTIYTMAKNPFDDVLLTFMQTMVYYRGIRFEFLSEMKRWSDDLWSFFPIDDAEDDGIMLFMKLFFPEDARQWSLYQHQRMSAMLDMVEEAADEEQEAGHCNRRVSLDADDWEYCNPSDNDIDWDNYTQID